MITHKFVSDDGIDGLSIEIDNRGADFYSDGMYYAWDGNGLFNKCQATNKLTPYISRNSLKEAFKLAETLLNTYFDRSIGVYVDNDGNVDPLNEIN